jgi:two-component system sensor histidine kinase/response regulator
MNNLYNWSDLEILLVEDSPTQLELLSKCLLDHGITVYTARDGQEAFKFVSSKIPKLIISDIEMPLMNGYDLCRKIKQNEDTKTIPVILLTNLSDPMDVIQGIECGADNFLTKPCHEELLLSSIQNALQNQKRYIRENNSPLFEVFFNGKRHKIKANHFQITDLLLSTYSSAIDKNKELEQTNKKLSVLHLELQKKNIELTKHINEKNMFLGMAAHDLRNPLNAIQGYSDVLLSKLSSELDEKILRIIMTISKSSKFMLQLVNDLLDLSVLELGKLNLKLAKENIQSLVENNCLINDSIAEKKNIKINFKSDQNIPEIVCDSNKIEQVLNNLIGNAIKFSHPGCEVNVSLKNTMHKTLLISIADTGVGISKERLNRLFDSLLKRGGKGTAGEPSHGLGMAIVKRIVEAHKGKIWVESELGAGSVFFVELPIQLIPLPEDSVVF